MFRAWTSQGPTGPSTRVEATRSPSPRPYRASRRRFSSRVSSRVTERPQAAIDVDVSEMIDALAAGDWVGAWAKYSEGGNSRKGDGFRTAGKGEEARRCYEACKVALFHRAKSRPHGQADVAGLARAQVRVGAELLWARLAAIPRRVSRDSRLVQF